MKHFASPKFWVCFDALPIQIQNLAHKNYKLLKNEPSHPSLRFKFVSSGKFRSVRIGLFYRALGIPIEGHILWFWIGNHTEYDEKIS